MFRLLLFVLLVVSLSAQKAPTIAEARAFLDDAEARLLIIGTEASRASWVQANFITDDTEALSALANERSIALAVELAKKATRFDKAPLPEDMTRKMRLLKLGLTLAAPDNPKERAETTRLAASLEGVYGKGKYCPGGTSDESKCLDVGEITKILANSRDPKELLDVWKGWQTISRPMKKDYVRFVE